MQKTTKGKMKISRDGLVAGLMLTPAIIFLIVCSIYPFIWIFRYICYDYNGFTATFTGTRNITRMLGDKTFWNSVGHTFEYAAYKLIFIIPLSLLMAVLLNMRMKGSNLFRGMYFMPTIISTSISGMIFAFIFATKNGIANSILMDMGVIDSPIKWLMSRNWVMVLSPVLKVVLMLAITSAFKDYEAIMVLSKGGPGNRSMVMFLYIYNLIFGATDSTSQAQIGYGALLSIMAALIVGTVTIIYNIVAKKLDDVV